MITNIIFRRSDSPITSDKPHYENVPFKVPSSWVWTTLGEIGNWQSGATPSRLRKDYYGGNIPWLKTGDLNDGYISDIPEYITETALKETSVKLNPKDSVLIAMYGATIGKVGILSFPATTNQACCACTDYLVKKMYLFYFLLANREKFIAMGGGGAQPNISKEKIVSTLIPLPPKQEQSRIVEGIEHWLSLVDCIEKNKDNLQRTIKEAKSKILTLAIHGKLVPQAPTDEPASELLKRINPKAEIISDNGHYQKLPEGWCETILKHVITIKSGYPINVRNCMQGHYPIYGGNGITGYTVDYNIKEPTIVIGRVGFYCGSVYLVKEKAWVSDNAFTITIHKDIFYKKYLYYLIQFLNLRKYSNSTAQPVISGKTIYPIHVIIPPINEQHRIVSKIEEIFTQLDAIEASL